MRMLVLGAGLQGCACAYDLLQVKAVTQVTLADLDPSHLPKFLEGDHGGRLQTLKLDVTDGAALRAAIHGHESVMSALPYYLDAPIARMELDRHHVGELFGTAMEDGRSKMTAAI